MTTDRSAKMRSRLRSVRAVDRWARKPTAAAAAVVALAVALYGSAPESSRAGSTRRAPAYRLAYTYDGDAVEGVFVIEGDGSLRRRVTRGLRLDDYYHRDFDVDWSPDSRWLALAGEKNDLPGIFRVSADGSHQKRLTTAPCYADYEPEWSPDGRLIAFRHDYCERARAFVIEASGQGRRPLIDRQSFAAYWSGDGKLVTFVGLDRRYRQQIFTAKHDGSGVMQLTSTRGKQLYEPDSYGPSFAPSGRQIAYTGNYYRGEPDGSDPGTGDVCVVDSRNAAPPVEPTPTPSPTMVPVPGLSPSPSPSSTPGAPANCLTNAPALDETPSYSPDGEEIVFVSFRDGNAEIYKMESDGSDEQRLTTSPGTDGSPTWSPDGRWIGFVGEADGSFELFVMRSDGTGLRRLTRTPGDELAPAWSPI